MIKCRCEDKDRCSCEQQVVCLKHVTFHRGERLVLDDITFCIDEGVFLGIIGPNGGGKTTLLRHILGTLPVQAGRIEVFGHGPSAARRLIGYVPQKHEIDRNFPATALDVVLMGAAASAGLFRRIPREVKHRAGELLDRVGIGDLTERPIGRMSGGQQQRTFIARALIAQPRLLVLDEPTSGIDSAGQQQLLHLIRDLKCALGLTVIMVSHDVGQLAHYADQMACLNRKLHWHDRSALLTEQVLSGVYAPACEMDAYRERVREIAPA